jgi:hypothetical protein
VPLLTHLYLSKPDPADLAQRFHQTAPVDDAALFGSAVAEFVKALSTRAGRVKDPASYASMVVPRLIPAMLPYDVGSDAEFSTTRFNGRPLGADAFDVMLSLAAGTAVSDGVGPDVARIRPEFPYCGLPYDDYEQTGMRPLRELIGLSY